MLNIISPTVVMLVFALCLNAAEAHDNNAAAKCAALRTTDFSMVLDAPTQILSSRIIEPQNGGVSYCEVRGYVSPATGFELRLPAENWNEKFWMVGNGGSGGQIPAAVCENRVRRGYACVATDMGHTSTSGDGKWAYDDLRAEVDWGFRATHVAALAGKAITGQFYGKAPARSYFAGCSTGGRQGLVEAQRFPWDFDGIVAGAPALSPGGVSFKNTWMLLSNRDSEGKQILRPDDVKLVHDAVVSHCDIDDNVRDGLIGDPRKCRFDPASLACAAGQQSGCLNATQIDVLRKFYNGPGEATGHPMVFAGAPLGSELNWINFVVFGTDKGGSGAGDFWRYIGFYPAPGPTWQMKDFDFQRDYKRLDMTESLYSATNPDMRRFKEAGGKLIMWSGWEDPSVVTTGLIDYYELTERAMGGPKQTADFFRLFTLPGVGHCGGGPGAFAVDYDNYIEAWVEHGKEPNALIAYRVFENQRYKYPVGFTYPLPTPDIEFSRPVYPYPTQAQYTGKGDPKEAKNWRAAG